MKCEACLQNQLSFEQQCDDDDEASQVEELEQLRLYSATAAPAPSAAASAATAFPVHCTVCGRLEDVDGGNRGIRKMDKIKSVHGMKLRKRAGVKTPVKSSSDDESRTDDELDDVVLDPSKVEIISVASKAAEQAEEFVRHVWQAGWKVVNHHELPKWLRDNDFLIAGHRPQLNSYTSCFKSVFRIHTETGNIWTHLLGFIAFIGVTVYFLTRPTVEIQWQEKAVFSAFFAGAILCLGFSTLFHTVFCHSERVGRFFNKLDYCGIALLTMGSFVPWLYYSFYCDLGPKIAYLVLIFVLGSAAIVVSLWDKFAEPKYRAVRAGTFIGLGLSGVIPAMHYVIEEGFYNAVNFAALGWLVLMAFLYISGAIIYAVRIPERLFPGKFDIWFQSHQIFHIFVLAAAFVHYHGISEIANYRLTLGDCLVEEAQTA